MAGLYKTQNKKLKSIDIVERTFFQHRPKLSMNVPLLSKVSLDKIKLDV
jgi:hypothetical protein